MNALVDQAEALGSAVLLSTIPNRTSFTEAPQRVLVFNQAIKNIASGRHLALVDLFAALSSLPSDGLSSDLVHPTVEPSSDGGILSADFTSTGLSYGFDIRNLLTVQALDRLAHIP